MPTGFLPTFLCVKNLGVALPSSSDFHSLTRFSQRSAGAASSQDLTGLEDPLLNGSVHSQQVDVGCCLGHLVLLCVVSPWAICRSAWCWLPSEKAVWETEAEESCLFALNCKSHTDLHGRRALQSPGSQDGRSLTATWWLAIALSDSLWPFLRDGERLEVWPEEEHGLTYVFKGLFQGLCWWYAARGWVARGKVEHLEGNPRAPSGRWGWLGPRWQR